MISQKAMLDSSSLRQQPTSVKLHTLQVSSYLFMKNPGFAIPNLPVFSSGERLESYAVVLMCPMADQCISVYLYIVYLPTCI